MTRVLLPLIVLSTAFCGSVLQHSTSGERDREVLQAVIDHESFREWANDQNVVSTFLVTATAPPAYNESVPYFLTLEPELGGRLRNEELLRSLRERNRTRDQLPKLKSALERASFDQFSNADQKEVGSPRSAYVWLSKPGYAGEEAIVSVARAVVPSQYGKSGYVALLVNEDRSWKVKEIVSQWIE